MDKMKIVLWALVIFVSAAILVPLSIAMQEKLYASANYDRAVACDYNKDFCTKEQNND